MKRTVVGWVWVAGQVLLIGALIVVPGGDDWPTPSAVDLVADVLFFGGLGIAAVAALRLGSALTPTPVPTRTGRLATGGPYRFVRHPIYTGVVIAVAGMTLRSGSWIHLTIAVATVAFFHAKAAWEEGQLRAHYAEYEAYAATTPRFLPRVRR